MGMSVLLWNSRQNRYLPVAELLHWNRSAAVIPVLKHVLPITIWLYNFTVMRRVFSIMYTSSQQIAFSGLNFPNTLSVVFILEHPHSQWHWRNAGKKKRQIISAIPHGLCEYGSLPLVTVNCFPQYFSPQKSWLYLFFLISLFHNLFLAFWLMSHQNRNEVAVLQLQVHLGEEVSGLAVCVFLA